MSKLKLDQDGSQDGKATSTIHVIGAPHIGAEMLTQDNLLISAGRFNAGFQEIANLVPRVIPTTEIGVSMVMLDTKKVDILAKLDVTKVEQVKNLHVATRAWYQRLVGIGIDLESMNEKGGAKGKSLYTNNMLQLSPVLLTLLGLDDAAYKAFSSEFVPYVTTMLKFFKSKEKEMTAKYLMTHKTGSILTYTEAVNAYMDCFDTPAFRAQLMDAAVKEIDKLDKDSVIKSLLESNATRYEVLVGFDMIMLALESALHSLTSGTPGITNDSAFSAWIELILDKKPDHPTLYTTQDIVKWFAFISNLVTSFKGDHLNKLLTTGMFNTASLSQVNQSYLNLASNDLAKAIEGHYENIEIVRIFTESMSNFYSSKEGFMHNSYGNTPKLIDQHRKLLLSIANAQDTATARLALDEFRKDPIFVSSVAGLVHGVLTNTTRLDTIIINDILSVSLNEEVVRAFKDSPFAKDLTISLDTESRINDYGAGISGMTLNAHITADTTLNLFEDGTISVGDGKIKEIGEVIDSPHLVEANRRHFAKLAMLLIGADEVNSPLAGITDLSGFNETIEYSKAVRDDMLPKLRLINNCVGAQVFMYRESSKQWFKTQLYSYIDLCRYLLNNLAAEKDHARSRLYADAATENINKVLSLSTELLKAHFDIDIESIPTKGVPVISFIKVDGNSKEKITDREAILSMFINHFRKSHDLVVTISENLKMSARVLDTMNKSSISYRRSSHPLMIKASYFKNFEGMFKIGEVAYDLVDIESHRNVRPTPIEINEFRSKGFRTSSALEWLAGSKLISLIGSIISGKSKDIGPDPSLDSRFGIKAPLSLQFNSFIVRYAKARAKDLLTRTFRTNVMLGLRSARAAYSLNHNCYSLLKLSHSVYEGIEHGLSPEDHTFTTSSDEFTLEYMLSHVGIKLQSSFDSADRKFLMMIDNLHSVGGPIKLSEKGRSILGSEKKEGLIKVAEVVELAEQFKMQGNEIQTVTFYTRDEAIIDKLFADFLVEDFSSMYDVTVIEDGLLKSLRLSSFDELAFIIGTDVAVDLNVIDTLMHSRLGLVEMAKSVADHIVPEYGTLLSSGGKKKEDKEEEEEEENPES